MVRLTQSSSIYYLLKIIRSSMKILHFIIFDVRLPLCKSDHTAQTCYECYSAFYKSIILKEITTNYHLCEIVFYSWLGEACRVHCAIQTEFWRTHIAYYSKKSRFQSSPSSLSTLQISQSAKNVEVIYASPNE